MALLWNAIESLHNVHPTFLFCDSLKLTFQASGPWKLLHWTSFVTKFDTAAAEIFWKWVEPKLIDIAQQ